MHGDGLQVPSRDDLLWALSQHACDAYLSLLSAPKRRADIASDILSELTEKGFAGVDVGENVFPFFPPIAVARAAANMTAEWLQSAPDFERMAAAHQAAASTVTLNFEPNVGVHGAAIQRTSEEAVAAAHSSLQIVQPRPRLPAGVSMNDLDDPSEWSPHPADLMRRGVGIQTIYDDVLLDIPAVSAAIASEENAGAESRISRVPLPTYMIIIDRRTAFVFSRTPNTPPDIVTSTGHVELLIASFERFWERGVPVSPSANARGLDDKHRQLVALIMSGMTKKAAARTLGIDVRTLDRWTKVLEAHYGVRGWHDLKIVATREAPDR
jgi:hypothetical protein